MSWPPRTLFGRNLLLMVTLIAGAQLLSLVLVRELLLRPRLVQVGESIARNVAAVRAGLMALPPTERTAFVDAFNKRGFDGATDAQEAGSARPDLTPLQRRMVRQISARVAGEGAEVVWRRDAGGSLALRVPIDATPYWIVLPGVLPAREFTGAWIVATLAGGLLAVAGAVAIERRLNRPLAQVVAAAGALARGAPPQPLPEDGPAEIAALAGSFNHLVTSLARADRERALMLAGVSHDLRTPLAKLRLGVEILADRSEPELTASMNRSVEEMDAIVGQFLDYARADVAEATRTGEVDTVVRAVAAASADHGRAMTLVLGAPAALPLRADALSRCLSNLVENAYRHGRPPVAIATGEDAQGVWIEVADAGPGIAPADVETLKQPFQRAHAARSGAPGAGLGLAIVERLVRAQGGRLDLLANAPQGLRARISLPRGR